MSAKAIREVQGKSFLNQFLSPGVAVPARFASVTTDTNWDKLVIDNPWLKTEVSLTSCTCHNISHIV
jgi:hypothetical protein